MKTKRLVSPCNAVVGTIAALLLAGCARNAPAEAKTTQEARGFSFAVYGDSRSMMYLPYRSDQEQQARQLMVDMFELVLPSKVAAAVVQKHVKLTYDPVTKELVQIVMPFDTASEVTTLTLDKGWVTEASVEDVKLLPGVRRTMFRLQGGEWVAREIVKDVRGGRANLVLNTGDMVWWGKQGNKPSGNPYWKLVNEDFKQLPHPDKEMRDAGLPGRVFPAVGNHEVWEDSDVEGLLSAFPYLKKFGVSDKQLIYKFDYQGVRFIFLWTGKYDYHSPSAFDATQPVYEAQMKQLQQWLDEAKSAGTKNVFILVHPLSRTGLLPLWHWCHSGVAKPTQDNRPVREGPRHRCLQRTRAYDRGLRGGRREVPAPWRRGR